MLTTEDLEEASKILTSMWQEEIDVFNIKGCIMHYFPIIPTCAGPFLTNKDESFDDDLTCQLSEIIKANNLMKKNLFSGIKPNAKDIQRHVFCINTYYDSRKKKSRHSASGHAYGGISDILKRRQTHQKTFMRKTSKLGGKNCITRQPFSED